MPLRGTFPTARQLAETERSPGCRVHHFPASRLQRTSVHAPFLSSKLLAVDAQASGLLTGSCPSRLSSPARLLPGQHGELLPGVCDQRTAGIIGEQRLIRGASAVTAAASLLALGGQEDQAVGVRRVGVDRNGGIKGDVPNCCGKMPSLRRAGLPASFNLPKQSRMSPSPTHKRDNPDNKPG